MATTLEDLSRALAAAVESGGRSVVRVEGRRRLPASGIAWSDDGVIVTAHHTLERDEGIVVGLADGTEAAASLVGRDPSTDLAVLRVQGQRLEAATWAEEPSARVGHIVLALGRPGATVLATQGIISALGEAWRTPSGGSVDRFFQTDVVMYPGFSGGPLVDASGQTLGLNTSALARGISLTIPSATLRRVTEALLRHGRIQRGYLGVGAQPVRLPEDVAAKAGQASGLMLASVEPDSPAGKGGLLLGDVLISLDGEPLRGMEDLLNALGSDRVGKTVEIGLLRGGQMSNVKVRLEERGKGG
ncbi:MAG TPA: trypsin-like peptidase domain-containing protein [Anaerolineales bacterium]|nr:trypsin-like peptidase domain-containing protein [Anaerolineales bacterium]